MRTNVTFSTQWIFGYRIESGFFGTNDAYIGIKTLARFLDWQVPCKHCPVGPEGFIAFTLRPMM
jgi:hypothetical protein